MAALCATLLVGCGDDGDRDARRKSERRSTAAQTLDRPVYPRCGTEGFGKPRVKRLRFSESNRAAWSLRYARPGTARRRPQQILLVEFSPSSPAAEKAPGAREVVISGRRVTMTRPNPRVSTAQWKARRAVYSAIATGNAESVLRRFIACLP